MAEMAERVSEVCAGCTRPEIRIDLEQLKQEQVDRAAWYEKAMTRPPPIHSWDDVSEAMAVISTG